MAAMNKANLPTLDKANLAPFIKPWRGFPQVLMFYAGMWVLGAAILTFLHVQFPATLTISPQWIVPDAIPTIVPTDKQFSSPIDRTMKLSYDKLYDGAPKLEQIDGGKSFVVSHINNISMQYLNDKVNLVSTTIIYDSASDYFHVYLTSTPRERVIFIASVRYEQLVNFRIMKFANNYTKSSSPNGAQFLLIGRSRDNPDFDGNLPGSVIAPG